MNATYYKPLADSTLPRLTQTQRSVMIQHAIYAAKQKKNALPNHVVICAEKKQ